MSEIHQSAGSMATETPPDIGLSYAAVGIPQGIVVDHANGDAAGGVRRGGELVSLELREYELWTTLLTPMTPAAIAEAAVNHGRSHVNQSMTRLAALNLLTKIEPGKALGTSLERLRPLPLGVGLGNLNGDPERFEIQNASLSLPSPVSLDEVAVMFWWEFDGTRSLREISALIAAKIPGLSTDHAEAVASQLAYALMASRLIYLDVPAPKRGE
jgi:hypothetical protein